MRRLSPLSPWALPATLALVATLATGCRNPEYGIRSIETLTGARGGVEIEPDLVRVGMSEPIVCDFDAKLQSPYEEVNVGEEPVDTASDDPTSLADKHQGLLLCSSPRVTVYDDGEQTWVRPRRSAAFTPLEQRLVEAVCLADGWVGLTESCTLLGDDGHAFTPGHCVGELRATGPDTAAWLSRGLPLDAHTGEPLESMDAVLYAGGRRYVADGRVLYGPDWEAELPADAADLFVAASFVHVRHRNGQLSVWAEDTGAWVAQVDDPMPAGGRVSSHPDTGFAYHIGPRAVTAFRVHRGSVRPGAF